MIVRCKVNRIDEALSKVLKLGLHAPKIFSCTPGKDYVVIGLTHSQKSEAYGISPVIQIMNDNAGITFVPLALFEIVEATPSRMWKAVYDEDGTLRFWPSSFYQRFYHDDLSEGDERVRSDFRSVFELLYSEARELNPTGQS